MGSEPHIPSTQCFNETHNQGDRLTIITIDPKSTQVHKTPGESVPKGPIVKAHEDRAVYHAMKSEPAILGNFNPCELNHENSGKGSGAATSWTEMVDEHRTEGEMLFDALNSVHPGTLFRDP